MLHIVIYIDTVEKTIVSSKTFVDLASKVGLLLVEQRLNNVWLKLLFRIRDFASLSHIVEEITEVVHSRTSFNQVELHAFNVLLDFDRAILDVLFFVFLLSISRLEELWAS